MKSYKRYLSVLLVCVLLFVPFSTVARAEYNPSNIYFRYSFCGPSYNYCHSSSWATLENIGSLNSSFTGTDINTIISETYTYYHLLEFSNNNSWNTTQDTPIFKKGENVTFGLYNIHLTASFQSSYAFLYSESGKDIRIELFDQSGKQRNIYVKDSYTLTKNSTSIDISSLSVTDVPFDVYRYRIVIPFTFSQYYTVDGSTNFGDFMNGHSTSTVTQNTRIYYDFATSSIKSDIESTEVGLFKSIVTWLKNIKNGITDLFDSISELPNKILNGIKSLFIPSEDYFTDYGDRWDELLSSRFGAVYQVGNKAIEFARMLLGALGGEPLDSISFPQVSIPVGSGVSFDFGGWQVPIKYNEFSILYTGSKTIFGFIATMFFIKGVRKRSDEVMGVES